MTSELAPFAAAVLRDQILEELNSETERLRTENKRLKRENSELKQIQHYVTIRDGTDTHKLYACGAKNPRVLYEHPTTWGDIETQINLRPADPIVECAFRDIDNAQLRIGGKVLNFRDVDSTFIRGMRAGPNGSRFIKYFWEWTNQQFASNVCVCVWSEFGPIRDWQDRGLQLGMPNAHALFRPEEVPTVFFEKISFTYEVDQRGRGRGR